MPIEHSRVANNAGLEAIVVCILGALSNTGGKAMTQAQQQIVEAYRATGRIVFIYPRLGMISRNGMKREPIAQAIKAMNEAMSKA